MLHSSIRPARFYGTSLDDLLNERERKIAESRRRRSWDPWDLDPRPRSLLQPAPHKEEFWKQNEALAHAFEYSQDDDILCCFVFQDENERRRFVVTYPEDFWTDCERMPLDKRVFYEVIPENSPCFLYYDLEFEVDPNQDKDGVRMTQTLINVTCEYIAHHWKCSYDTRSVINLDSSRQDKFSKHLIFSTNDYAFANNYQVGCLVKMICSDIIDYVSRETPEQHDILQKFSKSDLQELFVETSKGKKIFVDLNVYTKNRHFRTYKATKWGKNSHLHRASECQFNFSKKPKNQELDLFLNSLIAYLPKKKQLRLLSFDQDKKTEILPYSRLAEKNYYVPKEYEKSPYPVLDNYISDLVKPGKIRVSKFLESKQLINYEIAGYRYCENIGRWHKSNNIYYIVDIVNKKIYQKCHDEDCAHYISAPKKLPVEVIFYFDDEIDTLLYNLNDYDSKNSST